LGDLDERYIKKILVVTIINNERTFEIDENEIIGIGTVV